MSYSATFEEGATNPQQVAQGSGWLLLEFGTNWCSHCQLAQDAIETALKDYPGLTHIKEEDGRGRKLGRYFQVRLWPTLILLQDGEEVARCVRPVKSADVAQLLAAIH